MKDIEIAIIEDSDDYRQALETVLEVTPGFRCIAAYPNGELALAGIPKNLPDIVLVDLQLPGLSGIEVMSQLKKVFPKIQFMVLTVHQDDDKIFDALSSGASGYLLKGTSTAKIIEAIRELYDGGSPMSAQIARKVVASFRKPAATMTNPYDQLLTHREKEVLEMLSQGKLYKQIMEELHISISTVKSHCRSIYDKLHVTSKVDAINKYFPR